LSTLAEGSVFGREGEIEGGKKLMIEKPNISKEFEFIRGKLEYIAKVLAKGDNNYLTEAAFLIGCLHSVCYYNSLTFKESNEDTNN
jgi:hypothetical protein